MPACISLFPALFGYTTELEKRSLWNLWRLRAKQRSSRFSVSSVVIPAAPRHHPQYYISISLRAISMFLTHCPLFHSTLTAHTHACSVLTSSYVFQIIPVSL